MSAKRDVDLLAVFAGPLISRETGIATTMTRRAMLSYSDIKQKKYEAKKMHSILKNTMSSKRNSKKRQDYINTINIFLKFRH